MSGFTLYESFLEVNFENFSEFAKIEFWDLDRLISKSVVHPYLF